jgi:hypothetical protein
LVAASPRNDFLVAAKKSANSRQGGESQLETAGSAFGYGKHSDSRAATAEARFFTYALLLGEKSTGNGVQATPGKQMRHKTRSRRLKIEYFGLTPCSIDVEWELIWLGEESVCTTCHFLKSNWTLSTDQEYV